MAMLFLTCSKVVMPIKLLALTISHMLMIDGYMPPGTQWYTSVHKQFKKKISQFLFLKKTHDEGDVCAPILEYLG